MGRKKGRKPEVKKVGAASHEAEEQSRAGYVQGEKLDELLQKIGREFEMERTSMVGIPDKIWIKQFAIGVNDVTRVLERMSKKDSTGLLLEEESTMKVKACRRPSPLVPLQVVLVAIDCMPKLLTQHIPVIASSVGVPVIPVRDYGGGSIRLGQLVKLKTAMAIGVKARDSRINHAIEEFLHQEAA